MDSLFEKSEKIRLFWPAPVAFGEGARSLLRQTMNGRGGGALFTGRFPDAQHPGAVAGAVWGLRLGADEPAIYPPPLWPSAARARLPFRARYCHLPVRPMLQREYSAVRQA